MPTAPSTDRVDYTLHLPRPVADDLKRLRELAKRKNGVGMTVGGWFGAFIRENIARLERGDAGVEPAAAAPVTPFHGLPDDAPSVD